MRSGPLSPSEEVFCLFVFVLLVPFTPSLSVSCLSSLLLPLAIFLCKSLRTHPFGKESHNVLGLRYFFFCPIKVIHLEFETPPSSETRPLLSPRSSPLSLLVLVLLVLVYHRGPGTPGSTTPPICPAGRVSRWGSGGSSEVRTGTVRPEDDREARQG